MVIDISILVGALLFAVLGYFSGALRQVFKIIVVVAAYFIAKSYSYLLEPFITSNLGTPSNISKVLAQFSVWFVVAMVLSIISGLIIRKIFYAGDEMLKGIDQIGGSIISLTKYMLIIYIVFATILSFRTILTEHKPIILDKIDESMIVGFIDNNNFLKDTHWIGYSSRLSEISVYQEVMINIGVDCHALNQAKVAPAFCLNLLKIAASNQEVNILDKRFREIVQDEKFQNYIMSDKVKHWIAFAKKKRAKEKKSEKKK